MIPGNTFVNRPIHFSLAYQMLQKLYFQIYGKKSIKEHFLLLFTLVPKFYRESYIAL